MRLASLSGNRLIGQMLSFDFMIATALLLLVLTVILIRVGYDYKGTEEFKSKNLLMQDADAVSGMFFSEGFPDNWTTETVQALGLEENGRIDINKLGYFNQTPYLKTISLLGIKSDYNITILSGPSQLYSFGTSYSAAKSIVKKDRIGVLENGTIVSIRVLVFEK